MERIKHFIYLFFTEDKSPHKSWNGETAPHPTSAPKAHVPRLFSPIPGYDSGAIIKNQIRDQISEAFGSCFKLV